MTLSPLNVVQQIPQETKHRDNISRSTSNNSSQAQECKFPDVLVRHSETKWSQLKASEAIYSGTWREKFTMPVSRTFWKISLPINVIGSGLEISRGIYTSTYLYIN